MLTYLDPNLGETTNMQYYPSILDTNRKHQFLSRKHDMTKEQSDPGPYCL